MKKANNQFESWLAEQLKEIMPVETRSSEQAAQGRAAFLAQGNYMSRKIQARPVAFSRVARLNRWIDQTRRGLFDRKERSPMFATLATLIIVFSLVFGGGAATVYAAQDSLPGDSLYSVKVMGEDARLQWTNQAQEQVELALQFAARRVLELKELKAQGQPADVQAMNRFQMHVEAALKAASGMPPEDAPGTLAMVQLRLQEQERSMAQLQAQYPDDGVLAQARVRLQEQIQLAGEGCKDPLALREHLRLREQAQIKQGQDGTMQNCGEDCLGEPQQQQERNQERNQYQQVEPCEDCEHLMTREQNREQNRLLECQGACDDPTQDRDQDRDGTGSNAVGGPGETGGNPTTGGGSGNDNAGGGENGGNGGEDGGNGGGNGGH